MADMVTLWEKVESHWPLRGADTYNLYAQTLVLQPSRAFEDPHLKRLVPQTTQVVLPKYNSGFSIKHERLHCFALKGFIN